MKNRTTKFLLVGFLLIALIAQVAYATFTHLQEMSQQEQETPQQEEQLKKYDWNENTGHDALLDYEGMVFYFDATTQKLSPIGNEGKPKYSPLVSPDGEKILYRYSTLENDGIIEVGIMDFDGNILHEILVDTLCGTEIFGLEWLDNTNIGVTCHVNPSTAEYLIYDATSAELVDSFVGSSFSSIPNSTDIAYVANVPHWSDVVDYPRLMVNDKEVYVGDQLGATISSIVFSQQANKLSFVVTPPSTDAEITAHSQSSATNIPIIVEASYNPVSQEVYDRHEIAVPEDFVGYLGFNENNTLCLLDNDKTYIASGDTFISQLNNEEYVSMSQDAGGIFPKDLSDAIETAFGENAFDLVYDVTIIP